MGIFDNEYLKSGIDAYANFMTFGMAGAIGQAAEGSKMASKAQEEIENYKRQELVNPYKDLTVSTLGADIRKEELSRNVATMADVLAKGGSRAAVGGVTGLVQSAQTETAKIAAYLDEQQKEIDKLIAGGEERVMQMKERREEMDLAGLAKQYEIGLGMEQAGQQSMAEAPWKVAELGMSVFGGDIAGIAKSALGGTKTASPKITDIKYEDPIA